jgi:dephospho-CoA kinase
MLVAGLTGNYGMGKSTVLKIFERLGAVAIGADVIVHELLDDGSVRARIREVLGEAVFSGDGSLDRGKVASIIFRDREKKEALEAILHPLVFERVEALLKELEGKEKIVIIEIPLLFEKGYGGRFQRTITVYADEETAVRRLQETGVSRDDVRVRMEAQMPIHEKIRKSDFTVNNNGTPEETEKQVRAIYDRLFDEVRDGYHKGS